MDEKVVEDETGTTDSPRDEVLLQFAGTASELVRSMVQPLLSSPVESIPYARTYILFLFDCTHILFNICCSPLGDEGVFCQIRERPGVNRPTLYEESHYFTFCLEDLLRYWVKSIGMPSANLS